MRLTLSALAPYLWPVISHAAMNQSLSGFLVPSKIVPAVAYARRLHFGQRRPRVERHASPEWLQKGHTKPFGQRSRSKKRSQAVSSGKNLSNSDRSVG